MTHNNLCSFCTKKVDFYMPPHIEPDSCGNYVVMQPTYEERLKADMVGVLDKIRAEIEEERKGYPPSADEYKTINKVLQIIDKYRESER